MRWIYFAFKLSSLTGRSIRCASLDTGRAATIARRLLEIGLQVGYLCSEQSERERRGELYLAYFWHNAREIVLLQISDERRQWWEKQYDLHKRLLPANAPTRAHRRPTPVKRAACQV